MPSHRARAGRWPQLGISDHAEHEGCSLSPQRGADPRGIVGVFEDDTERAHDRGLQLGRRQNPGQKALEVLAKRRRLLRAEQSAA